MTAFRAIILCGFASLAFSSPAFATGSGAREAQASFLPPSASVAKPLRADQLGRLRFRRTIRSLQTRMTEAGFDKNRGVVLRTKLHGSDPGPLSYSTSIILTPKDFRIATKESLPGGREKVKLHA